MDGNSEIATWQVGKQHKKPVLLDFKTSQTQDCVAGRTLFCGGTSGVAVAGGAGAETAPSINLHGRNPQRDLPKDRNAGKKHRGRGTSGGNARKQSTDRLLLRNILRGYIVTTSVPSKMAFFLPTLPELSVEPRFDYRQRYGKINWNLVEKIDIDEAVQLGDFSKLSLVKDTLTFSLFEQDDLARFPDQLLVKGFRLLQMIVEFQGFQIAKMTLSAEKQGGERKTAEETIEELKERVKTLEEELATTTKELKNKSHILSTYEYLLRQPSAAGLVSQMLSHHNAVKCPHCLKLFLSSSYLDSHISKRHQAITTSLQEHQRTAQRSQDIEATLESMKILMSRNMQSLNEAHTQQIEAMQKSFEMRFEQLQAAKMEAERSFSRPGTADTVDTSGENILRELLKTQQSLRLELENRDQIIKEQLKSMDEKQAKLVLESQTKDESIRTHMEEILRKSFEKLPIRGRTGRVLSADEGSSPNEEEFKVKSNAGEIESDEASGHFRLHDDFITGKTRRMTGTMAENREEMTETTPTFARGMEVEVSEQETDVMVVGGSLERAAVELGVPKQEAAKVEFVLRAYAKAKDDSPWKMTVINDKPAYRHIHTGATLSEHPDCQRFKQSLQRAQLLSQKVDYSSFLSLEAISITQTPSCSEGIKALFNHKVQSFQKHQGDIRRKVSSSLNQLKDRIPEHLVSLSERHRERMKSEPGYRRYLAEINQEADELMSRAQARRSLVDPSKALLGKIVERKFAEDSKKLRVDERDTRKSRGSL